MKSIILDKIETLKEYAAANWKKGISAIVLWVVMLTVAHSNGVYFSQYIPGMGKNSVSLASFGMPSFGHSAWYNKVVAREIPLHKVEPFPTLRLQGLTLGSRPMAIVNGAILEVGDTRQVHLTNRDAIIKLVAIHHDTVEVSEGGRNHTLVMVQK